PPLGPIPSRLSRFESRRLCEGPAKRRASLPSALLVAPCLAASTVGPVSNRPASPPWGGVSGTKGRSHAGMRLLWNEDRRLGGFRDGGWRVLLLGLRF